MKLVITYKSQRKAFKLITEISLRLCFKVRASLKRRPFWSPFRNVGFQFGRGIF